MKKGIIGIILAALLLTLAGCGTEKAAEPTEPVDLTALYASWSELLPEMFLVEGDMRLEFFGMDEADYVQAITAVCADGLGADEVWLIQATDAEALERLKQVAENRLSAKADETVDYNPEQYAVVQKAELITAGDYLALLVSPDVEQMKADAEKALK